MAIKRVGKNRDAREIKMSKLYAIHGVPRREVPPGHIEHLADLISQNGYDITKPVMAIELPNRDIIVTGGHHRIAAMALLGEKTIPVHVQRWDQVAPAFVGWMLLVGKTTGYYPSQFTDTFVANLDPDDQRRAYALLAAWKKRNGF